LAIVTSGSKSRVEKDINSNNIKSFFEIIITGDDIKNPKPHREGLELALEKLNLKSRDVVYVGDAKDDYKMAKSAGIDFIGIKSDFANLSKDHPKYDLCNITELQTILGLVS
jgi:HAD superfamily hydrolase (TIGR01509 family)